ncbi:3'-5' exonuclease [Arthrobacter sp. Soil782]|uniref:bifunctional 3'-5' exonuclease/DNA polymerase n=1 Tax=Arthrobacter sp. Soil782 TaxID=1736410 RepID=UPI0006FC3C73|nr:bifunctional 3'-5' exonuclease/DNA polymerase [Arthrobacter sp. Soil782]KRF08224.1 3'-5' exonuclease [Arthrobacter sp. Soil782]
MYIVLAPPSGGQRLSGVDDAQAAFVPVDSAGAPTADAVVVPAVHIGETVRELERPGVRWVWDSTRTWYPRMLAAGVTVERCHDVALSREILRHSPSCAGTEYGNRLQSRPDEAEDANPARVLPPVAASPLQGSLFEAAQPAGGADALQVAAEFAEQQQALKNSDRPAQLALLVAAESAGALIAAEMEFHGIPWRADLHDELLTSQLGPRPREGHRPTELERLAAELRGALNNPRFNPDSPQELLRALHRAGIEVSSTRSWELQRHTHPAIAPLLQYKKLSRLLTANGWTWLDTWVHGGRFRPEYIVGGSMSGRWASNGGGALQIPRQVRDAVRPDPGHVLIVADAAQLEPRVLAALGKDSALATAGRGLDLYQGIADQGFGGDRAKAKLAMLGAMYGATTGESGRLMPQLTRTYPQAISVVEAAARTGEAGGVVASFLGRGCPPPSERWLAAQRTSSAAEQQRADSLARSRGRFTRNFVVQATAAEWALCWLAELRRRLRAGAADYSSAHIVFFLHDEVMLHVPAELADRVSAMVTEAARSAAHLMFGHIPVEFPVNVVVVNSYADAK